MEKEIIIGTLGLIIGYFIFKFITRKEKNSTNVYSDMSEHIQKSLISDESTISDILTNDKYKVKGQWDK